jgi:hypothetical protein
MYELRVFYPGERLPAHRETVRGAPDVQEALANLLKTYPGCERVTVLAGLATLYSVDGNGDRWDQDRP